MMRLQGSVGGELVLATKVTAACANITSLLATFSDLGASREVMEDELPPELGVRQITIYNDLRSATAALGEMAAATPAEVANVRSIISLWIGVEH